MEKTLYVRLILIYSLIESIALHARNWTIAKTLKF